jgi:hypothetical protein
MVPLWGTEILPGERRLRRSLVDYRGVAYQRIELDAGD